MIEKKKLLASDWKIIEEYLIKDNEESLKMAIIEADKIFLKVVRSKGYKSKDEEGKILQAIKEMKNPEAFLASREKTRRIINEIGFEFGDPYSAKEVILAYKEGVEDLLFGIIEEKRLQSFKYRFWGIYYFFYKNRKKFQKILIAVLVIVLMMLFIADTELGKNMFDLIIEKIHFIIRLIITALLLIFAGFFFVTFSIIMLESRARKRSGREE